MSRSTDVTRSAMWSLAHPLRLRLFELLAAGPATGSRLAALVGESRGSTSYHLRVLARTGAIAEDVTLGTRRERWWRRAEDFAVWPTPPDVEARAITRRMTAVMFAREESVRRRFVTEPVSDEWETAALVGNWFFALTPDEARALGIALQEVVAEARRRAAVRPETGTGTGTLVALSILPVRD
jgi:DNA-binding transcriptional ArsR family regulator